MARPHVIGRILALVCLAVTTARAAPDWDAILRQERAWYATAEATAVAQSVLLYQTESGGWPKNTDFTQPPSEEF